MKGIREMPSFDRPREKLAKKGPAALSDIELISVIIGKGISGKDVFQVATEISKKIKTDSAQMKHPNFYESLRKIEGVGSAKASQIVAGFELARRYLMKDNVRVTSPSDILPLVSDIIDKKQEYFICISLNGAGEVVGNRIVTVGLLNHSLVHPREVFADVITDRAASVIFVHNHPSGSLEPSEQDLEITKQLVEAGTILGIKVMDHIIVAKKGYLSLKERGVL
ncbi:MAG: DNA repair protein RadC [Thermodesulfobacteriota bacterium]|nr:DNA repair protein RadC [Thermodesulfobacteriota bacterium]